MCDQNANFSRWLSVSRKLDVPPTQPPAHIAHQVVRQTNEPNKVVLTMAGIPIFTFLRQRHLRWLARVSRMNDCRIPEDLLHGELAIGKRSHGHSHLIHSYLSKLCVRKKWENLCPRWLTLAETNLEQEPEDGKGKSPIGLRAKKAMAQGKSRSTKTQ